MTEISTEKRAEHAILDINSGKSIRAASKDHDVNRTYLTRRILGIPTRAEANEKFQALSQVQEAHLASWAVTQASLGYAPPLHRFKGYAQRILAYNSHHQKLGKKWYTRFLNRNPSVKTLRSHLIDYRRYNGACAENINIFFDRFNRPEIKTIPRCHIYNADEVGLQEGVGDNGMVVGDAYRKFCIRKDSNNRRWTSILECISGDGKAIPPLVIFAGKSVQQQWFPNRNHKKWREGISMSLTTAGRTMRLRLSGLKRHLKRAYRRELTLRNYLYHNDEPTKQDFLESYWCARKEYLIEKHIELGWKVTGIWPRDRSKALNNRWVRDADRRTSSMSISTPSAPDLIEQMAGIGVPTPKSSRDLVILERELFSVESALKTPTARLLFRKLAKALDQRVLEISSAEYQVEVLQAQLEKARPSKRRNVVPDPNQAFVDIVAVGKVQEGLRMEAEGPRLGTGANEPIESVEAESNSEESVEDCIEVLGSQSGTNSSEDE
ncbi:hypothetical protein DL765_010673 [Monosporascus sp. GIB2]|nr:hypothetical protein DL765_010673 [Monosporascus sp. GIB2]